jgi:hypothetical protein
MSTLLFELLPDFSLERCINDHGLFRRANRAVVEARTSQNIANSFRSVRRSFDEHRNVTGPDTERRLAGRICSTNKADPARRENHGSSLVLHQSFSRFDRAVLDAIDRFCRKSVCDRRIAHHSSRLADTSRRRRMG